MKLISMTDFVLEQSKESYSCNQFADRVECYANFLKEKLSLEMFVPCRIVKGIFIPMQDEEFDGYNQKDLKEYQEAKDKLIFHGFKLCEAATLKVTNNFYSIQFLNFSNGNKEIYFTDFTLEYPKVNMIFIVEDLVKYNLELTPTAEKQIGLI